ncbi:MAG: lysozyme inhibitor LprI family protein [Lysobacteraceae bacterium]
MIRLTLLMCSILLFAGHAQAARTSSQGAGAAAIQSGDACTASQTLPDGMLCYEHDDGTMAVINCAEASGHVAYTICRSHDLESLQGILDARKKAIETWLDRPSDDSADYKSAKASFTKAQSAWETFASADCEVGMALNLTGNGQTPGMLDCMVQHYEERISEFEATIRMYGIE